MNWIKITKLGNDWLGYRMFTIEIIQNFDLLPLTNAVNSV